MPIQLTASQRKIIQFALFGAAGCFAASIIGELWLSATFQKPEVEKQPVAVCLLLDCSGSMQQGGKFKAVKDAASRFIRRRSGTKDTIAVVGFGSTTTVASGLTNQHASVESAVQGLSNLGGTDIASGIRVAAAQLRSTQHLGNILLFTDGQPTSPGSQAAADQCRRDGLKIVGIATHDVDRNFMNSVTSDPSLVFMASASGFEQAFQRAEKEIYSTTLVDTEKTRSDPGYLMFRIGGWTALLAVGVVLALVIGQNSYLRRSLFEPRGLAIAGVGGLAAGLFAGVLGQSIFSGLAGDSAVADGIGRILGWIVLGGLLGSGLSLFVPNLKLLRGLQGGLVGGGAGAIAFLVVGLVLGNMPARLVGAALLGLCIGAMIALIEAVFREAWLEVHYGPNEQRNVTLGKRPVAIGSNAEACTVFAQGVADVALRYTLLEGRITCEDVPSGRSDDVMPGDTRQVGNLSVVVCGPQVSPATPTQNRKSPGSESERDRVQPASPTEASVVDADFILRIRGRVIPLAHGVRLTSAEVAGLETTEADGGVAQVSAHPNDPQILGLQNLATRAWFATLPDGLETQIEPGRNVRLASGTKINFGVLKGEIEEP